MYFCASNRERNCDRWRTKDILNGPYEKIEGSFPFWDPNLFVDDDGRVYFYWGCSNVTPIYGVELDPESMLPKTEPKALVEGHPFEIGYERFGENNSLFPAIVLVVVVTTIITPVLLKLVLGGNRKKRGAVPAQSIRGSVTQHPKRAL